MPYFFNSTLKITSLLIWSVKGEICCLKNHDIWFCILNSHILLSCHTFLKVMWPNQILNCEMNLADTNSMRARISDLMGGLISIFFHLKIKMPQFEVFFYRVPYGIFWSKSNGQVILWWNFPSKNDEMMIRMQGYTCLNLANSIHFNDTWWDGARKCHLFH